MPEQSILEEAQQLIHGARNVAYGHPRDNFAAIASLWNGYLGAMGERREFSGQDVANMMILMKVGRVCNDNWHRDSYTDIAGYAGTAERMQEPIEVPADDEPVGEAAPHIWATWEGLVLAGKALHVPAGTHVVSANGTVWRLNDTDYTKDAYGGPAWLWIESPKPGSATVEGRVGPFIQIEGVE